jgi:NAD(P)-dependent dehydrogenase (short-subunit alcohol dehydrogenase family)
VSRALITGGRGGIGRAIAEAYDGEVVALDLPEFDVASLAAWQSLEGEFDAAFLNAGIGIGYPDVAQLPDEEIERIVDANFLGVVYGTRECARRLMPNGGAIVATASLAGLTGMPYDPMYTATKHAVVGFVRGAAPGLLANHDIRLNALCPGFTDTPIVEDELRGQLPVPLMEPSFVAEAALTALKDDEVGRAWIAQPNRILPFTFPRLPGPR